MTVAEWKAAVYQHRGLPASVRLLLVYLADHMADDLTVSIPQNDLSAALGLLRQAAGRLLARACDAGMLRVIEPARGRRPAIYAGTRRGNTGVASTTTARGNTGVASSSVEATHVVRLREDAEPRRGNISGRRGNTSVALTRNVSNTHQLPLEDSPSQHLQLLVLDEDAETAPDSVTHGQVLHGSTSPAVSRRVGGPGGGIERPDVEALCRHLADRIQSNGNRRPAITKEWRQEALRLLDNDKLPLEEAHELIDWCQTDGFWAGNILSMRKFRKQYDQLRSKRLYEQQRRRRRTHQSGPTDEYLRDAYARAAAHDEARGL